MPAVPGPKTRDLVLELIRVGPTESAWRDMQGARVHIKELGF
jgi:hypothetical protein